MQASWSERNMGTQSLVNATMSLHHIWFLRRKLGFNCEGTHQERWQSDRFTAFKKIFEICNQNCCSCLIPDDLLSLNETLCPARVSIAFWQFNKSKPAKYRLLFRSINSAWMPNEYYVTGTDKYVMTLVKCLSSFVSIQGRNLSLYRFYTSIPLAFECLQKKIRIVRTLQQNRKGADHLKSMTGRKGFSGKTYWKEEHGKLSITSYVANLYENAMSLFFPLCLLYLVSQRRSPQSYSSMIFAKVAHTSLVSQCKRSPSFIKVYKY